MLSAEQSHAVSKRLVVLKEREASEGRLVAKRDSAQLDLLKGKRGTSRGHAGSSLEQTAKLHELSRENLKLQHPHFPGLRGSSTKHIKGQSENFRPAKGVRASGSQLKFRKNADKASDSPAERRFMDQNLLLQSPAHADFTLPKVHQLHQASDQSIHGQDMPSEVLLEDFNLQVNEIDPLWSGYNRISFKQGAKSKKHLKLSKEGLHRHLLKQSQKDAMQLVKKKSDKFSLF